MQRIAWVVSKWNEADHQQASQLSPDLLFCNYKKIPDDDALWSGSWQWALYDVVEADVALHWFTRGVALIETWDVGALLKDPRLQVPDVMQQAAGKIDGE
jgi:glycerophosphoryl diester phosphodiesterase